VIFFKFLGHVVVLLAVLLDICIELHVGTTRKEADISISLCSNSERYQYRSGLCLTQNSFSEKKHFGFAFLVIGLIQCFGSGSKWIRI